MNTIKTVRVIRHVAEEGPGRISTLLEERGVRVEVTRVDRGEAVGEQLKDGLVVMGGPMGVYDGARFPNLLEEQRLIGSAIAQEVPVLGVCLGSQLIAATLGARVYPGSRKEIGWYPVTLRDAAREDALFRDALPEFTPLHWHGDVFELPHGAVALAQSELTPLQAFRSGSAHALLFHLEAGPSEVEAMVSAFADELTEAGVDGAALGARARQALADLEITARTVLGAWADAVALAAQR